MHASCSLLTAESLCHEEEKQAVPHITPITVCCWEKFPSIIDVSVYFSSSINCLLSNSVIYSNFLPSSKLTLLFQTLRLCAEQPCDIPVREVRVKSSVCFFSGCLKVFPKVTHKTSQRLSSSMISTETCLLHFFLP